MNEEIIADFKQFVAATVTQQTSDLRGDIDGIKEDIKEVKEDIKALDKKLCGMIDEVDVKLDTISAAVGERFEDSAAKTTKRLDDHEVRITKLEPKPA